MKQEYRLQILDLTNTLEKFEKENVEFKSQISNLENEKYMNKNVINQMQSKIDENDRDIALKQVQLERAMKELNAKETIIVDLETNLWEMNDNYKNLNEQHLAFKTQHHDMAFQAEYHKMEFEKQSGQMENLEEASNKQIVELKILKKDFDDLNSNYRISCKKLDEEFQKYVKLVGEHERTKQNLDNKISENTKQKYELQNMNDKYQKMRRKCEKKNRAIKLMQEKKEELISDAKKQKRNLQYSLKTHIQKKLKY